MKRTMRIIWMSVLLLNTSSCLMAKPKCPEAKVIVKVQDEDENPIEGADVTIGFQPAPGFNKWHVKGKTDGNGIFSKNGHCNDGVWADTNKQGYYESSGGLPFTSRNHLLNRWEPWPAHITITLRKKKNPVPMYAKKTGPIKVPVIGKPVGYDLEKGDWVKPYGKGEVSDFVVTTNLNKDIEGNKLKSYTLTFSNKLDGIQEYTDRKHSQSNYKWPYEAPEGNYNSNNNELIVYGINKFPIDEKSKLKKHVDYIFRLRTKTDKKGNIIAANYGKIKDGIKFFEKKGVFILNFTYYFNPDPYSRSLEFDPDKNLFKFTKDEWEHEVREP